MDRLTSLAELCLPQAGHTPEVLDSEAWQRILVESERAGVFPAVFQRLRESGLGNGLAAEPRWARQSRLVLARNLAFQKTQDELLAALGEAGLPCRPIKGVRLARRLYGDIAWRESSDVDLICPPRAVAAVYGKLKALGLTDISDAWTETGLCRALAQPEFMFPEIKLSAPDGILVELHWDWTGEEFPAGDPLDDAEAYTVYLCRHAAKHFWSSLQWSCDIELLLRQASGGFNWPRFWRLAKRASAGRDCAASLHICAAVFGSSFGAEQQQMRKRSARRLAAMALLEMSTPAGTERTRRRPALRLLQADGWARRIQRCRHWLRPAPRCFNGAGAAGGNAATVWAERYCRLAFRGAASLARSPRWNARFTRAAELSSNDWAAVLRAAGVLFVAKTGLRLAPYRWMAAWASAPAAVPSATPDESREIVLQLSRAVRIAARHHLLGMTCLPQSLALKRLLGKRGILADLKIGVRAEDGEVKGHAWLEWNGEPINDHGEIGRQYTLLPMGRSWPAAAEMGGPL